MVVKINIGLLENEQKEVESTKQMLQTFFSSQGLDFSSESFSNSNDFLASNVQKYDLIILDILLDNDDPMNGIDVAKEIRKVNKHVVIIFVTKTAQFALDGYKVDAIDYILKPLTYEDFYLKLVKAMNVIKFHIDKEFILKNMDGIFKIKESEIIYIEVKRHYLDFHLKTGVKAFRGSMKEVSQELTDKFAKTSNSFIVNLHYTKLIKKDGVVLECEGNSYEVPLTKLFKNSFILALENYSGRN